MRQTLRQVLGAASAGVARLTLATESRLRPSPPLSILVYHRVTAKPEAIYPDGIEAAKFDQLMRRVAAHFRVLSLGQAAHCLAEGRLPERALVLTFDDGYADNAELAMPILQRHGLVGTFFVASGFLDGGCMWNDRIIHSLRTTRRECIDLTPLGLGRVAVRTVGERESAIEAVIQRIKYSPLDQRERKLDELARATAVTDRPRNLMMRSDQVTALQSGGMEVGGHTVNHPILTELDESQAAHEISAGRRHLQSLTNAPVDVFAYPNGKPGRDYGQRDARLVREAGFRAAVSTAQGVAHAGDPLFELPRYSPWTDPPDLWLYRVVAARSGLGFGVAPN